MTDDIRDLVVRLRQSDNFKSFPRQQGKTEAFIQECVKIRIEAADALERQAAEVERLQGQVEALVSDRKGLESVMLKVRALP